MSVFDGEHIATMALYADIFLQFLRLGLYSFGGPAAHLTNFEQRFVRQLGWLNLAQYQQLVALCQLLPGPASSQVGIGIGLQRAGLTGALLAFTAFTLPSFIILTCIGLGGTAWLSAGAQQGAFCGVAIVVLHAIWQMSRSFAVDHKQRLLAIAGLLCFCVLPANTSQLFVIVLFAAIGAWQIKPTPALPQPAPFATLRGSAWLLLLFFVLFTVSFYLLYLSQNPATPHHSQSIVWTLVAACYQAGAWVFGGGHVVLPLLQQQTADLLTEREFLAGYAAAQLVPGPLFSFAGYLGATIGQSVGAAILATLALFLPGSLLVCAIWPIWHRLAKYPAVTGAVKAVNCAVLGLLAAGFLQFVLPHAGQNYWQIAAMVLGLFCVYRKGFSPIWFVPLFAGAGAGIDAMIAWS